MSQSVFGRYPADLEQFPKISAIRSNFPISPIFGLPRADLPDRDRPSGAWTDP